VHFAEGEVRRISRSSVPCSKVGLRFRASAWPCSLLLDVRQEKRFHFSSRMSKRVARAAGEGPPEPGNLREPVSGLSPGSIPVSRDAREDRVTSCVRACARLFWGSRRPSPGFEAVEGSCPSPGGTTRLVSPKSIQRDPSKEGSAAKRRGAQAPGASIAAPAGRELPRGGGSRCGRPRGSSGARRAADVSVRPF
jgi:hypothetical protein